MVLWKNSLDAHISVPPPTSPSFLPLIFAPPGSPTSIHIAVYLPTSGQESEFVDQLIDLKIAIDKLKQKHPDSIIFIRGDSNVNPNNKSRARIFTHFCSELELVRIPIKHKTYHHFLGDGLFDSNIDVILQSSDAKYQEKVVQIMCKNNFPEIDSGHDIIISTVSIPYQPVPTTKSPLPLAPLVPDTRHKVVWAEETIPTYKNLVAPRLTSIRENWYLPNSAASVSLLLDLTNCAFNQTASTTSKTVSSKQPSAAKTLKITKAVRDARSKLTMAHSAYKSELKINSSAVPTAKAMWMNAKKRYRFQCRSETHTEDLKRDSEIFSVFSSSPKLFHKIRSSKSSSAKTVPYLTVGDKTYPEHLVGDGLFASISDLKKKNSAQTNSPQYNSMVDDFKYILKICRNKQDIPKITLHESSKILNRMKPYVRDFWSITPLHFIHAGEQGYFHFNFLMNAVIMEINSSSVKELNTVLALLLHKGHGKPVTSDRAYRTISTCPVVSKALDMYLQDLFIDLWNSDQASTQYQGERSSHELASLLITETIQHSLHSTKKPVFMLLLDARSAFDTVVIEFLVRNLYLLGMSGQSLLYLAGRLTNRVTFCSWKHKVMGPIHDEHGLEQGGCNSSDLYKIYNNDLLKIVQSLRQGVDLGSDLNISIVGQADDIVLLSNSIYSLFNILQLVLSFCGRYKIDLCADKTKLLLLTNNSHLIVPFNPIIINEQPINFTNEAEHVGVLRSTEGNLPHLFNRILMHKRQLGSLMFTGIARSHRGNPAAAIKLDKLYGVPVLLSGTASLVLSKAEVDIIDKHYRTLLSNLLKLPPGTPQAFIYFMSGSLPAKALLHQRQLVLFGMICHLPNDPLYKRAIHSLHLKSTCRSWFYQIRDICLMYGLPHPLEMLRTPPSKSTFRRLVRSRIVDYWEKNLRQQSSPLTSLLYFKPQFHSLLSPHPIYWTAGSNPYEVAKAVVQGKMLSGRYRTEVLASHWSTNPNGFCQGSQCNQLPETLDHILLHCTSYRASREKLCRLWYDTKDCHVSDIIRYILSESSEVLIQFILDATTHPKVISLVQAHGQTKLQTIFHLTRTWCFTIHKQRLKMLGKWFAA